MKIRGRSGRSFSGGRALKLEAREPEAEEREAGDSEQEA